MTFLFILSILLSSQTLYATENPASILGQAHISEEEAPFSKPSTSAGAIQQGGLINSVGAPPTLTLEEFQQASAHPVTGLWGVKQEQIEYAMKHSKHLICVIDAEGKFKNLNDQWKEVLGWEIEELLNTQYLNLIHPKDAQKSQTHDLASFKLGLTNRFRCKDGTYRWLDWISLPNLAHPSTGSGFISFAKDITVQKELEKYNKKKIKKLKGDLDFKEALLKAVNAMQSAHTLEMFATGDDIIVKNHNTLQIILNNYLKIIGCKLGFIGEIFYNEHNGIFSMLQWEVNPSAEEGLKGTFDRTVRDKPMKVNVKEIFLEPLCTQKKIINFKNLSPAELEKIAGHFFLPAFTSYAGIPLFGDQKQLVGIIGLAHDRLLENEERIDALNLLSPIAGRILSEGLLHKKNEAERMRREADLEAETLAKSTFITHMSHEIRTPLTGLLGMLDCIDLSLLPKEVIEIIEIAKASGLALKGILSDVLDLSKIEANQLKLEQTSFNLREWLKEIEQLYRTQAEKERLEFKIGMDRHVPEQVLGDPTRLRQILTNLLSNAIKFTEKGTITVQIGGKDYSESIEPSRKGFILKGKVADTGIGMSSETQDAIFQSFVQGDASITRKYGGTGLGLYITKKLCKLMNGELKVKSKLNEGSTFSFKVFLSLPEESTELKTPEAKPAEEKIPIANRKILIAEDNLVNQKVLTAMLSREGCQVKAVINGREALEAVQLETYDLVLMDGQMPEMDGFEATRRIRAIPKSLPIIGVTAHAMSSDKERFLQSMDGYLTKPIHKGALIAEIQRCLAEKAAKEKEEPE